MTLERTQQMQQQIKDQFHGASVIPLRQTWQGQCRTPHIRGVQMHDLARWWPVAEPMLARLLPYFDGRYTLSDIRASVANGDRWLWISEPDHECVMLTQINEYPAMKVMFIFAIAGKLPVTWRGMLRSLEDYARSICCQHVELHGRRGWIRKMDGYAATKIVLRKKL